MKIMLLCLVLLALATVWLRTSELAAVRTELATARATIDVVEQQRVPKADLARARAAAAAAGERTAALERELADTREQLAATQEKIRVAELRMNLQADKSSAAPPSSSPGLVKGTYTLLEDTLVYSPDARLRVGDNILISSPTGLMLSDKEVATVAGDLAVETPSGTMQATHAFIDVNGGKIEMTADRMTFTNR
jgi:hypothetical protein